MIENNSKLDKNRNTSSIASALNAVRMLAVYESKNEKEVIIKAFADGDNSEKIFKNKENTIEKGIRYFAKNFEI